MIDQQGIKLILTDYFLVIKDFYDQMYAPAIKKKLSKLFEAESGLVKDEPWQIQFSRGENLFTNTVLDCLVTINSTMTQLSLWQEWFINLVNNLKLTNDNILTLSKGPDVIFEQLAQKETDVGYIRLIVNNATTDFFNLLTPTAGILGKLVELRPKFDQLKSPIFNEVLIRLDRLTEINFNKLLTDMQKHITDAYNSSNEEEFLRNFAALLHMFGGWRIILLQDKSKISQPGALRQLFQERSNLVEQMNQLTNQFQEYVEIRNTTNYHVRQSEMSIIRMMLTYGGNAEGWWFQFLNTPSKDLAELIPTSVDPNQLLIGVANSLALLEDLDQRISHKIPELSKSLMKLGELLASEPMKLYGETIVGRIKIWDEFRPKWIKHLRQLRKELNQQIQKTQPP
jgi:hypothetical protein